jgi:transcriptional regulator with XRE-family HTH domain
VAVTVQNGFAIRAFRNLARFTTDDAAAVLEISAAHYRKIEAETRDAQPEQIAALAKAFNVPAAALVRTPPGQPPELSVPDGKVTA